jgi:aryl-alcohol dehydrogenase-like predicted oxidoreductase
MPPMPLATRPFARSGIAVGELGCGMWGMGGGMGGWADADERASRAVLQAAVEAGITFFDSALVYGSGATDRLLGDLVRANPSAGLIAATKVPPLDREWPARPGTPIRRVFPPSHIRSSVEASLRQMRTPALDLLQFHVWNDDWVDDDAWLRTTEDLRREGKIRFVGISINRWEPWNAIRTVRSGRIDSVQVVYNVFEQRPEDELFPACREMGVAVVARVPLDEGSLTGSLTAGARWPDGDFRNNYFSPANLAAILPRVEALRPLVPAGSTLAAMALRYVLSSPDLTVAIPGMRSAGHLAANLEAAAAGPLSPDLLTSLRAHRWDRARSTSSMS